jgi:hypothetical protein
MDDTLGENEAIMETEKCDMEVNYVIDARSTPPVPGMNFSAGPYINSCLSQ